VTSRTGLVGEEDGSLGHRADAAREAKLAQIREEVAAEQARLLEIGEVALVEGEPLEVLEHVLQARGHEVAPAVRQSPCEQAERRRSLGQCLRRSSSAPWSAGRDRRAARSCRARRPRGPERPGSMPGGTRCAAVRGRTRSQRRAAGRKAPPARSPTSGCETSSRHRYVSSPSGADRTSVRAPIHDVANYAAARIRPLLR
jgi:hypothetical protein